ncbi:MAG: tape measure protein, partial [Segatella copri]
MAVDIQGFDIVFSAANANHARTIDQSIANMGKNMGSLKQSSAAFADTMERLGRLDISKLANGMAAIKDAVNGIDKDRLKQVFAAGTTETQNMLTNITGMINKLSQAGGIKISPVVNPVSSTSSINQTSNATQSKDEALSEGKINSLWTERARLMIETEKLWKKSVSLQKEGKDLSQAEGELLLQKYQRLQGVINQLEKQKRINTDVYAKTENSGLIKVKKAEVDLERWAASEKEKAERRKTAIQKEEERKRQQEYKKQAEMWRAANNNKNTTLTGAVDFAGTANTLNRLVTAQKYLKEALASTKPNTPEWQRAADTYKQVTQRINETKKAMDGVKAQTNSIIPALKNLSMQLGLVFSVQQLNQWIKHMVDVRAQFELQQIALRSIIQDKQKADEIFMQVQQLALKSPFSIMELNKFTKQMAAYGVEADKLVDTTKRLADVSAGLGVDMGRLILAFGQVKTANYLRATEVRQFTEAGLNITQELANYFTELNGKMVTAGEVTEMITKRMVKFEDVAEVFKRVTSAGGMFYEMQEKQSEGLKGQIQRIGDAYSIMLNDIGKGNQGTIAAVLSTIRQMISSWRSIASYITVAATAAAAYIGVAKFAAIVEMLNKTATGYKLVAFATNAATAAQLKNNAAVVANPYALAAAAIALVVAGIYEWATATDQLTEDLQRMQEETFSDATDSVARFTELADTVRDVTKAYSERKEAMDEIQRSYGDILPMQQLEMDGIMSISDGYKEATEAIREYYRIKLEEEQKSAIEASTVSNMQKASSKIVGRYTDILEDIGASKSSIQSILNRIIEQLKEGSITTVKDAGNAFVDELVRYYNITDERLQRRLRASLKSYSDSYGTSYLFEDIAGEANVYREKIEGITQSNENFADITEERTHVALQLINKDFEQVEAKLKNVSIAFSLLDQLRTMNERAGGKGFDIEKIQAAVSNGKTANLTEEEQKVAASLQEIDKALAAVGLNGTYTWKQIYDATANNFAQMEWFGTVQKTAFTSFLSNLNQAKYQTNELAKAKFAETLQAKIESVDGTPTVREIKRIVKAVADANKLDYHLFDWITLDVKTSFESAGKEFDTQLKLFHEKILSYQAMMKLMYVTGQSEQDILKVLGLTKEQIDYSLAIEKAYQQIKTAMGKLDKENEKKTKKTKVADKTEQTLRERIKLIKEANQTFEKYAKEYDKVIAKEKTYNDLMDRAKDLNIADILRKDYLTNTATLEAMQNVYNKFKSLFKNKKYVGAKRDALKEMSDMKFEIAVELNENNRKELQNSFDKMFGGYQLFIELDKIGINQNLAKDMFDIDYTSLDEIGARWKQLFLDKINDEYKQMDASFAGFKTYEEAKAKLSQEKSNKNYEMAVNTEKKISEAFNKELESRMKEYAKYLKKSYSESVNEQVNVYRQLRQLQMDADFKRDAINGNDKLDENAKQTALQQIDAQSSQIAAKMQEELQKKLNKIQWDSFKDSPLFETVLSDIEHLSTGTIDMLIKKIEQLKDTYKGLDPKIVKELTKYTDQLTKQKINNNPFKAWSDALREINSLKKYGITLDNINEDLISESDELTRINAQIESYNKVLAIKQQMTHVTAQDTELMQKETKALEQQLQNLESQKQKSKEGGGSDTKDLDLQIKKIQEIIAARRTILASNGDNVVLSTQEIALLKQESNEIIKQVLALAKKKGLKEEDIEKLKAQIGSWDKLSEAQAGVISILNEVGAAASAGFSVAEEAMNAFGGSSDEVTKAMLQGFDDCLQACISLTTSIVAMGEAAKTASGIIGIIAASLTAVATLFKTIFNVHEAKLEKSIKEHQRQLKKLEAEYDNLSDAISNAFSGFQLGTNTQAAIQNLERQNEQYRAMIENEKEKKDADEDQIADWEQTIEDNLKKAEELRQQYFTELGGLGSGSDVKDAAEGFVDAWIEAFGETGDGLSGLKKDFDDFIRNIVKKQAAMKVADHWINKFGDMINAAFDKYGNADPEKIMQAIQWLTEEGMPQIDSFLEDFNAAWERYGISLTDNTSNLSGLAAGIQGVTEETAQILEALL